MIQSQIKAHPALPPDASKPEIIAASYEKETSDWQFRRAILELLPDSFGVKVASHYADLYQSEGRRCANLYMLDVKDDLSVLSISLASSNDDLIQYAKNAATHCMRLRYSTHSDESAIFALSHFIRNCYKINPPLLNKKYKHKPSVTITDTVTEKHVNLPPVTDTLTGILNRLCNEYWWRRTLKSNHGRNVEKHAIRSGYVRKNRAIYISDESFKRNMQQKKRNIRTLEQCYAVNESTGQEYTLKELVDLSMSNPKNRRIELMVRIRGFDELSKELGHVSMFYTITCPSKMHAYSSKKDLKTGKVTFFRNPKYNTTTPKDAQVYLAKMWARVRAKFKRDHLDYYGFRVTEAHHDGTPHWHLLIFMHPSHEQTITNILRDYALREDGNEQGAEKYRFKAENIDPKKGSATQYIAKYITKALDADGIDEDLYGEDAKESCHRVRAWASTWGVRQFQQLGGPPVTIYRELRRLRGAELEGLMAAIWKAADTRDWKTFVMLLGGPTVERKDYIVTIAVKWNDKPNRYLEPTGYQIIGVDFGKVVICTRIYEWKIEYRRVLEGVTYRGVSNEDLPTLKGVRDDHDGLDDLVFFEGLKGL